MGLLLEQPRGLPLSPPPRAPSGGVRNNMIQLRKQNTKRIIIEAREKKGFVCTEEVWDYCTLTNEINAGGYLYLSWYSKGNLGSVCLVADQKAKHAEKREASSARQGQGVIDWLISHPPARAFEGVSGRGLRRSQQCGRVFVAVSYTYLGGGMQPPGCRRLRV